MMNPANHLSAEIQSSVTIEYLNGSGQALKRKVIRNALTSLGRNEYRELVLKVSDGKLPQNFTLKQIQLFTRFVQDGKSSIVLQPDNVQLLISNCPSDTLKHFIKTLMIKHEAGKSEKPVNERMRLLAGRPRTFETISPVQRKDVQQANEMRAKANTETPVKRKGLSNRGPNGANGGPQKRARTESSENGLISELRPSKKPALSMPRQMNLSTEQSLVLSTVLGGKNVFFTGSAGTGKSYLLKRIIGALPPKSTYATASTGVAACHIGGTTLHAFAGIGSGKAPLEQCIELANRPGVRQHWTSCRHLIIDEISMVEGEFFDKLEAVARAVRGRDEPFGGIQLIVCGDFLQLPPVTQASSQTKFCFQAKSWRRCIHLTMELTAVRRQTDKTFINLLQAIRLGRCTEEVTRQLVLTANHKIERDGILATRLCTHKDDVDLTNERRLQQLPGEIHTYEALDSDPMLVKTMDTQCPVGQRLQLKKGAQIRQSSALFKFLPAKERGGRVCAAETLPKVHFLCGVTEVMKMERWVIKAHGGVYLSRQQLPLKLAWAISIHKSQGMTLDCVEISLSRVFESGQAYVALSRARSFEGLRVMDFDPKAVSANPYVLHFYARMKKERALQQNGSEGSALFLVSEEVLNSAAVGIPDPERAAQWLLAPVV
ncbi:PREDICTED: ATP-dependent DNA helicase PIF1 [Nanorana parkeri]|uniref:ATP-dependent DNA helicase PIF1 n=1 Tax=Nanorana parkeri TaxID=125878 RepID=UPI000854B3E2|nr:PREDICTED: ATP-dependent DNA helicase PIF1 [Nanorana parkeri]